MGKDSTEPLDLILSKTNRIIITRHIFFEKNQKSDLVLFNFYPSWYKPMILDFSYEHFNFHDFLSQFYLQMCVLQNPDISICGLNCVLKIGQKFKVPKLKI